MYDLLVHVNLILSYKSFIANAALESIIPCMNCLMIISVLGFCKCLSAKLTLVPDSCMLIHMDFETTICKLSIVILPMLIQTTFSVVLFVTSGTSMLLPPLSHRFRPPTFCCSLELSPLKYPVNMSDSFKDIIHYVFSR